MPLKTLVKVGGVTNLSDARYCAGMGVDMLGFRVIPGHANTIPVTVFQDIRGWITGPQIVAEIYGLTDRADLEKVLEDFKPDYLELGIDEFSRVGQFLTLPYILRLDPDDVLPSSSSEPSYILLADENSVTQFVPDYEILLDVARVVDLETALAHTGVSGVCLQGGTEIRPGFKTYDELAEILEALEVDG